MGPSHLLAKLAPKIYRLDLPSNWRAFSGFNVERVRRYLRRPPALGNDAQESAPVQGLDGQLEHKVEAILKFSMRAGRPHVLVVGPV
jgi:hypothetical protein